MIKWLGQTDGEDGAFIAANTHASGGNCFVLTTPSGKKLAGGNGPSGATQALARGLKEWGRLSRPERVALPVGKPKVPAEASLCTPPAEGLILKSYIRSLKRDRNDNLARILPHDLRDTRSFPKWIPIYLEPARFNMWLTEEEWRSLVPSAPRKGERITVPDGIQKRLFRFHLVNGTFGLPGFWKRDEIRSGELTLTVEDVTPVLKMRLDGAVLLIGDAPAREARGYDARLLGFLEYEPKKKTFTRFDFVAVGDYWGGDYEGGRFKRPGKEPLGFAFELSRGNTAVDLAPPRLRMDRKNEYDRYFAAERLE